jgi:hypothetical protein
MKRLVLLFVAIVVAGALGVSSGARVDAAGSASLTLHARQCPAGEPTTNIFTDCHPYPASRSDAFEVEGGPNKQVDRHGNATFTALSAGHHIVQQTAGRMPNEFLHERVFCSRNGGAAKELSVAPWGDFVVSLKAGDQVICDVYFIPESGQ